MAKILKFVLLACLVPYAGSAAGTARWTPDTSRSNISFIAVQNNAPVEGKFTHYTADITFDPAKLDKSSVVAEIDLAHIETSYAEVSSTLQGPDWFNVGKFPKATFEASQFRSIGGNKYEAAGTLTIRGVKTPFTLPFTLIEFSENEAAITVETSLRRTLFGVGQKDWSKTDVVKDDVTLRIQLRAKRS